VVKYNGVAFDGDNNNSSKFIWRVSIITQLVCRKIRRRIGTFNGGVWKMGAIGNPIFIIKRPFYATMPGASYCTEVNKKINWRSMIHCSAAVAISAINSDIPTVYRLVGLCKRDELLDVACQYREHSVCNNSSTFYRFSLVRSWRSVSSSIRLVLPPHSHWSRADHVIF